MFPRAITLKIKSALGDGSILSGNTPLALGAFSGEDMGRTPYIPIEYPFLLGIDSHGFTEFSAGTRLAYLTWYSWLYCEKKEDTLTFHELKMVQRVAKLHPKTCKKAVLDLTQKGFMEEVAGGYKFIGLKKKRDTAFGINAPASTNKSTSVDPIKTINQTKLKETKLNQTKPKEKLAAKPAAVGEIVLENGRRIKALQIINKYPDAIKKKNSDQAIALARELAKHQLADTRYPDDVITGLAHVLDCRSKHNPEIYLATIVAEGEYPPSDSALEISEGLIKMRSRNG